MKHVSVSVTANGAALAQALVVVNEPGGLLFVETDQLGQAGFTTQLSAPEVQLLVVPAAGFWPRYAFGVTADGGTWRVEIDLDQLPGRDRCWWYDVIGRDGSHEAGPIRIGVIDTGVGPHPGLQHVTNLGAVSGYVAGAVVEDPLVTVPSAGLDVTKHGTHVCGIIGHIPADANHPVGVARSAQLFSIRAFQAQPIESIGPSEPVADAEDVAEAIHILSSDVECDIINLSLGGPKGSLLVGSEIEAAAGRGTVCVCAAGNSGPEELSFPARLPSVVAVGAIGLAGWGATGSPAYLAAPADAPHGSLYVWPRSAAGAGVDVYAPGVGIISSVPPSGVAAMDGTSMAAPFVTAVLALMLSTDEEYHRLPRNSRRYLRAIRTARDNSVKIDELGSEEHPVHTLSFSSG